jgi:hypothetical protein
MTDLIPGVAQAKLAALALKALPYIAGAAALLAAGAWMDRHAPFIGAQPTIDRLSKALTAETALFGQERDSFRKEQAHSRALEAARTGDHGAAVSDANGQSKTCQARVDTARKSATAITHLLNEAPHANPDPAEPVLLDAGQLRNALGR